MGALVSLTVDKFAVLALDKVEKGKRFYVPLFSNKLLFAMSRILPDALMLNLVKNEFKKELGSE
jgi:short-subunit dehydrogenase